MGIRHIKPGRGRGNVLVATENPSDIVLHLFNLSRMGKNIDDMLIRAHKSGVDLNFVLGDMLRRGSVKFAINHETGNLAYFSNGEYPIDVCREELYLGPFGKRTETRKALYDIICCLVCPYNKEGVK